MSKETEKIEDSTTSVDVDASTNTTTTNKKTKTAVKLSDEDVIEVKALVPIVTYTCPRTQDYFYWEEVGDIQEMTYAHLKTMRQRRPRYFVDKWLKPMNDIVIEKLKLKEVFNADFNIRKDMKTLYGDNMSEIESKLSALSDEQKEDVVKAITNAVKQGKIVNIKVIRLIEKLLSIELIDLV